MCHETKTGAKSPGNAGTAGRGGFADTEWLAWSAIRVFGKRQLLAFSLSAVGVDHDLMISKRERSEVPDRMQFRRLVAVWVRSRSPLATENSWGERRAAEIGVHDDDPGGRGQRKKTKSAQKSDPTLNSPVYNHGACAPRKKSSASSD